MILCTERTFGDSLSQLHAQVERLTEINKDLRRKQSHMSQQMRQLVEERADLQALLQEQSRSLAALNRRLGMAQRDNEDLVQSQSQSQPVGAAVGSPNPGSHRSLLRSKFPISRTKSS